MKEFREIREAFENKCFDKDKIIDGPDHSVTWELSDYGKNENIVCTFLQTRDSTLATVIGQLQLSQDYTVPITDNLELHHMISKIQREYDNNVNKF